MPSKSFFRGGKQPGFWIKPHFALWNNNGADIYPLDEYNRLSYNYHQ